MVFNSGYFEYIRGQLGGSGNFLIGLGLGFPSVSLLSGSLPLGLNFTQYFGAWDGSNGGQ